MNRKVITIILFCLVALPILIEAQEPSPYDSMADWELIELAREQYKAESKNSRLSEFAGSQETMDALLSRQRPLDLTEEHTD